MIFKVFFWRFSIGRPCVFICIYNGNIVFHLSRNARTTIADGIEKHELWNTEWAPFRKHFDTFSMIVQGSFFNVFGKEFQWFRHRSTLRFHRHSKWKHCFSLVAESAYSNRKWSRKSMNNQPNLKLKRRTRNDREKKSFYGGATHLGLLSTNRARVVRRIWGCCQRTEPDPPTRVLIILL